MKIGGHGRWIGSPGLALLLACGGTPAEEVAASRPVPDSRPQRAAMAAAAAPAEAETSPGFVVWESNRGGAWRIWIRPLAGGVPRRLSPDEPGRVHCCAHVSPDGARVAYLSGEEGAAEYPADGMLGALHLVAVDGSGDRVVAPAARSYFENRAVVWRSDRELIHIDGQRATIALDLESGARRRLAEAPPERAWLIDSTLSWATTGRPEFAPYEAGRGRVLPQRRLGGCQPYFTGDGRWGYWTAGAGGPIQSLELATGRLGRILDKNDPRVPEGFGYAYFPMFSSDGRLFAWAASRGGHDHFLEDYEVFVAESDPETLELVGPPQRITRHGAADRFPDVWQPPLALGRHSGEGPLTVSLAAPREGPWRWRFGDGEEGAGTPVEHTWTEPGRYRVWAQLGEATVEGLVLVRSPRPPAALSAVARAGGGEILVTFDEPIDAAAAVLGLESGIRITDHRLDDAARSLTLFLSEPLEELDRLTVKGIRDRAQQPNALAAVTLEVEPPAWPASREGLLFLWQTDDAANLVADPESEVDRSYTLERLGAARLDAHFAMVTDGGSFVLAPGESRLAAAVQAANEVTVEATLRSRGDDGRIITWAGEKGINLWLEEQAGKLAFGLRTGARGPAARPLVELFELPPDTPAHVVVTYEPGRLIAYLNGERVTESRAAQGGFFHWREQPLSFGDGSWRGGIEGVAIYRRVLDAGEVAEAHRLQLAARESRPAVPRSIVAARFLKRSRTPSLAEISPYREALFTVDYEVERLVEGQPVGERVRVVEWAVQDGREQAVTRLAPGDRVRLTLEPFASQPQLEAVFLADTLGGMAGPWLYAADAAPMR